ncbi:MAG TPA: hypothetical protein VK518_20985 [Puia sp.]|nr:hypothetical protein [Puia sp.]
MPKPFALLAALLLTACTWRPRTSDHPFSEQDILHQLDLGYQRIPSDYFPDGRSQDIRYNFFLDLEHGYCVSAGSRIHLYADSTRWAVVFERNGYQNRGMNADIELDYFGNCIDYPVNHYPERNYITNASSVPLIETSEFGRIENKVGTEEETFEYIAPDTRFIVVRGKAVPFDSSYLDYRKVGILEPDTSNPRHLIGFADFVRYLQQTDPTLVQATDRDIRQHIPRDLPKLMTIDRFHFESVYGPVPPSAQETYQLIATVLVKRDTALWRPTRPANNGWRNWRSGNL